MMEYILAHILDSSILIKDLPISISIDLTLRHFAQMASSSPNGSPLPALSLLLFLLIIIDHPPWVCSRSHEFNPYKTLGLRRTASQKDIKQAYKRLAMEWHPDKNKSPEAEQHFMEINQAYKILSNAQKRKAYDTYGFTEEQFEQMRREQQHQHEQQFQYIRWPPPPRKKQTDITHFLLPFGSVLGTLFFIFLVGYLLNQMNQNSGASAEQAKRRRQANNNNRAGETPKDEKQQEKEWHPEDPKAPLTEEEKQQRAQARVWRVMGPMIRELRAETQFGLIRLLKPGCRSIVVLVDKDSKATLLQQFAKHVYCLRNNKTFSFGFLMVPKNLPWFRSLLELTLPGDEQPPGEGDAESVSTATTDSAETGPEGTEKAKKQEEGRKNSGEEGAGKTARRKLKEINPKHTLGTVLVICGWKLYFSIYHPMHRPMSIRSRIALAELGDRDEAEEEGDEMDEDGGGDEKKRGAKERELGGKGTGASRPVNTDNVLNGLPMFLDRLLEGTVRRYYVPEWPENLT